MVWNAGLGHAHPRMRLALAEAAARGLLVTPNAAFPAKLRAAELLTEVTPPGLEKTFFCLSGAEANENAVKIARLVTGRRKIVARTRSYHGATLAMLSLSGDPRREPFEPGLPGVVRMADPYCFRCPFGKEPSSCAHECAQDLETVLLREGPETVAAVIMEGVVGANGVFTPPAGYWKKIRAICDRHGVLLIADEVLSGFGRTGRWFAVDHDGVTPDLLTMAKGITAGYAPGRRRHRHRPRSPGTSTRTCWCADSPATRTRWCARRSSPRSRPTATRGWSTGRRRRAPACGARVRRISPASAPTSARCAASACCGPSSFARPGSRDPLPSVTMAKVAAALRRHHLHMHKRDNLVYFAPPLVITDAELDEAWPRWDGPSTRRWRHELHLAADREGVPEGRERAGRPAPRRHVDHVGRLRPVRQRRGVHRRHRAQPGQEPDDHQQQLRQRRDRGWRCCSRTARSRA